MPPLACATRPAADVIVGLDHGDTANERGDDGLETFFHPVTCDFNTGKRRLQHK